jgi:NADH-quinone oxidoreductase subunit E
MSGAAHKPEFEQPAEFAFSKENMKLVEMHISKYPKGRQASAVMPLLDIAQRQQGGWIPEAAMEEIGRLLDMPRVKVFEVATFYTMYNLEPKGKNHLQFCTTSPCWLMGSAEVVKACEKHLGVKLGETTKDGKFTLSEVECLGACVNGPVLQWNGDDFYEDLTPDNVVPLLETWKQGKMPKAGSQTGRRTSLGPQGATVLKDQTRRAGAPVQGEKAEKIEKAEKPSTSKFAPVEAPAAKPVMNGAAKPNGVAKAEEPAAEAPKAAKVPKAIEATPPEDKPPTAKKGKAKGSKKK